jgi:hypothetical protein
MLHPSLGVVALDLARQQLSLRGEEKLQDIDMLRAFQFPCASPPISYYNTKLTSHCAAGTSAIRQHGVTLSWC